MSDVTMIGSIELVLLTTVLNVMSCVCGQGFGNDQQGIGESRDAIFCLAFNLFLKRLAGKMGRT